MKIPLLVVLLLSILSRSSEAGIQLRGTVRDALSGDPLSAANIRIGGTSRGTIANADGRFVIVLEPGRYQVVVSSLGYHADTLEVMLSSETVRDIMLRPSEIIMPEVVVTSEDPAIEIMRRVIVNKKRWSDRLSTYEIDAFTRQTIRRDTAIAAIAESYTKGYWQRGDTLREIVRQRRQTANLGAAENIASVGRILNFNDDLIRFVGYTFIGPTAADALDYYDYKLLRTRSSSGTQIYDIRMIPRIRVVPLFSGIINVAGDSYALVGVDAEPNEAFVLPFVKEKRLRYRQQFALYEQTYWMPADIRIEGGFKLGIIGLSLPRIGFEQTSVVTEYIINGTIPDSIFHKPRLSIDSSAVKTDSAFWASPSALPLNMEEQKAYATLDSTQKLEVQFRPGGATATLGADAGAVGSLLKILDFSFNRVEGIHLGAKVDLERILPWLSLRAGGAYGFSDRNGTYHLGATAYPFGSSETGIGGEAYRRIGYRPDGGYYGPLYNTFTSLFFKNDYRDYFRSEGWRAFITTAPAQSLQVELSWIFEREQNAEQRTDYSFFARSRPYRPNPPVVEGDLRSIRLDLRLGPEQAPMDLVTRDGLEFSVERSSPSIASSAFNFTRYSTTGTLVIPTLGEGFLLRPMLRIRMAAGISTGALPPQRLFDIESASSGFGPFGVMRAMDVKEFSGEGCVAVNLEHNFRSIPFLALGIPFLYENGIELILHGGGARSWGGVNPTNGWYCEAGLGISRIFDLLRFDVTWRGSHTQNVRLTLSVANIL